MRTSPIYSERSGNPVANQFVLYDDFGNSFFQSYKSIIAKISNKGQTTLDSHFWDYSVTTGRYRNKFLNECIAETRKKIKQGLYKLTDLNGSNNIVEKDLKNTYFNKWKKEEAEDEKALRNMRYAERLKLNGGFNVK